MKISNTIVTAGLALLFMAGTALAQCLPTTWNDCSNTRPDPYQTPYGTPYEGPRSLPERPAYGASGSSLLPEPAFDPGRRRQPGESLLVDPRRTQPRTGGSLLGN